jgi:hypothetical protein
MITQERARELFDYDEITGVLIRRNGQYAGKHQTCTDGQGYVVTFADGKSIKAHRLIWVWLYGSIGASQIDHINRVRSDNRRENLRLADRSGNGANRRVACVKKYSTPKGVFVRPDRPKPYRSYIYSNGKNKYLGDFSSQDEAAHAYNKAAIAMFGEFACINPVGIDKPNHVRE